MSKVVKVPVSLIITILAAILLSFVIIFALIFTTRTEEKTTSDALQNTNSQATEGGTSEMKVNAKSITTEQLASMLDNGGSGFIYVGRPTCHYCVEFTPKLNAAIDAGGYTNVYYYNTDEASDQAAMSEMLDRLAVEGTPTFFYLRDGVEIDRLSNTTSEQAIKDFLAKYQ